MFRSLLRFLFVAAAAVALPDVARAAECGQLGQIVVLAHEAFEPDRPPPRQTLVALDQLLSETRSDDLYQILLKADAGQHFGNVQNHLTELAALTRAHLAAQTVPDLDQAVTPAFERRRQGLRAVVDQACNVADGPATDASGAATTGNADTGGMAASMAASGAVGHAAAMKGPAQKSYFPNREELIRLGVVVALLVGIVLTVILGHFGVIMLRLMKRKRRVCDIPAGLQCLLHDVEGKLVVMGRLGCFFEPVEPLDAPLKQSFVARTYCRLSMGGKEYPAMLLKDAGEMVSIKFNEPLSNAQLKSLWALSGTPVKIDFAVLWQAARRSATFGYGPLVGPER